MNSRETVIIETGVANTASMTAALERLGAPVSVVRDPAVVREAPFVVLPGVGAFDEGVRRLEESGLGDAVRERIDNDKPLLAVCLGMQLLAAGSEEGSGSAGLRVFPGVAARFPESVMVPQLGWNRVGASGGRFVTEDGFACFANSYRITASPAGWQAAECDYGGTFIAALERGHVLACQFHPELSGAWGERLLARWLGAADEREGEAC